MATTVGTLSVRVTAQTRQLGVGIKRAQAQVRQFSTEMQGMMMANGQSMVSMGNKAMLMGAAITTGMALTVKSFASLEQAMATATAVSDVTESQLRDMTSMAEDMSRTLGVSASNTAQAFYFLGSAGLVVEEQIAAFPAVTVMAKAAMMDMGRTAEIVVDTMKGFKIPFTDTTRVTNVLTKAVTSSNMTFEQLGQSMAYVSGIARTANMSLEETVAVIGLMANVGIKGSMAGTSLRRALINLGAPASEARDTLKELDVAVFDVNGKMKPFTEILRDLVPRLSEVTEETRNMALKNLFGARAITGMTEMVYQGAEGLSEFTQELENVGDKSKEVSDKQLKTLQGSMSKLREEALRGVRSFGGELAPAIDDITKATTKLIEKLGEMEPETKKTIAISTTLGGMLTTVGGGALTMAGQIGLGIFALRQLALTAPSTAAGITTFLGALFSVPSAIALAVGGFGAWQLNLVSIINRNREMSDSLDQTSSIIRSSVRIFKGLNTELASGELSADKYKKKWDAVNETLKKSRITPFAIPQRSMALMGGPAESSGPNLTQMNITLNLPEGATNSDKAKALESYLNGLPEPVN